MTDEKLVDALVRLLRTYPQPVILAALEIAVAKVEQNDTVAAKGTAPRRKRWHPFPFGE